MYVSVNFCSKFKKKKGQSIQIKSLGFKTQFFRIDFPFGFIFHGDFSIKSLKVQSLSNGSHIKFEIDQTFSRLPYGFSFVLKKVGLC